jgi:hypothetical protein
MAAARGVVLGAANVFVIAIGLGFMSNDSVVPTFVLLFGGLPGLAVGGLLGVLAARTDTHSPWLRAALLALPAMGVVVFLAGAFGMYAYVPVSCIPTVVAALMLERWTRRVTPPPVPVARVQSMRA